MLVRAFISFVLLVSLTACQDCRPRLAGVPANPYYEAQYEALVGTYRGVLLRGGPEDATITLELTFGDKGWGRGGNAEFFVSSPGHDVTYRQGGWGPRSLSGDERVTGMHLTYGNAPYVWGIVFVHKEEGQLIAIATIYPQQIPPGWDGPFDGLVLEKQ